MRSFKQQNLMSLALLAGCFFLVFWLAPSPQYQPGGIAYAFNQDTVPATVPPDSVHLLSQLPEGSKKVGRLIVEVSLQGLQEEQQRAMFEHAQELAASIGANAVVIEKLGQLNDILVMEGLAIEL